jgi:hypothetical protein
MYRSSFLPLDLPMFLPQWPLRCTALRSPRPSMSSTLRESSTYASGCDDALSSLALTVYRGISGQTRRHHHLSQGQLWLLHDMLNKSDSSPTMLANLQIPEEETMVRNWCWRSNEQHHVNECYDDQSVGHSQGHPLISSRLHPPSSARIHPLAPALPLPKNHPDARSYSRPRHFSL